MQIAKLLIIPFVCCIEYAYLGRRFTRETLAAIAVVVLGVQIVTGERGWWRGGAWWVGVLGLQIVTGEEWLLGSESRGGRWVVGGGDEMAPPAAPLAPPPPPPPPTTIHPNPHPPHPPTPPHLQWRI